MEDFTQMSSTLDEALYSRQLYAVGRQAMSKITQSSVLIVGLGGLGVEVAKCVILGGVGSVTLYDTKTVKWSDLSSQFYLTESDIGVNRAMASVGKLSRLNEHVHVEHHRSETPITDLLDRHQVIVVTEAVEMDLHELTRLNNICRERGIGFILADTAGAFARIFCDFGAEFIVNDTRTKEEQELVMLQFRVDKDGRHGKCMLETAGNGLRVGDIVKLVSVPNLDKIDTLLWKIVQINGMSISISLDEERIPGPQLPVGALEGDYAGGFMVKIAVSVTVKFDDLAASIIAPKILPVDQCKPEYNIQLHSLFLALQAYNQETRMCHQRIDVEKYLTHYRKVASVVSEQANEPLAVAFTRGCRGNLSPMNAFIGGVVAQEVYKACSGKFMPLQQWMYHGEVALAPRADVAPGAQDQMIMDNNRYCGQEMCTGPAVQRRLENLRVFIVGAGAIGCELLKNLAMMGVGCGKHGKILITDMDSIERSNLSRQFLFHNSDVGRFKSEAAARAAQVMNPKVNIVAQTSQLGRNTEDLYNSEFFKNIGLAISALDNVSGREYLDEKCVEYRIPFLDAGTMGPAGSTQVILPGLTKSYRCTKNPPDESYPMCTLKHFPYRIHHTLFWARDFFAKYFVEPARLFNDYCSDASDFQLVIPLDEFSRGNMEDLSRRLSSVSDLVENWPKSFTDCVQWARREWHDLFCFQIKELIATFPEYALTTDGKRFWSPPKVFPFPLDFCSTGQLGEEFVYAAACLRAQMFGIPQNLTQEEVYKLASAYSVEAHMDGGGHDATVVDARDDGQLRELHLRIQERLSDPKVAHVVNEIGFEKDNNTNHHMDFITAASNCRARNYHIKEEDKFKSKLIAGRIIPAIITTTSVVAGLLSLEIYKLCIDTDRRCGGDVHQMSHFRNGYLNLAVPMVILSKPSKPTIRVYNKQEWTIWDRFSCWQRVLPTLKHLLEHFLKEHDLDICIVSYGAHNLYNQYMQSSSDLGGGTKDLVMAPLPDMTGMRIPEDATHLILHIVCSNVEDDAEVPPIYYHLRD